MKVDKPMEIRKTDIKPILIWVAFIYFIPAIILGTIAARSSEDVEVVIDSYMGMSILISNFTMFFILLAMYYKKLIFDFKRITKKIAILILLSSLILLGFNFLLSYLFYIFEISVGNQEALESLFASYAIPLAISASIVAPFVEELAFRESLGSLIKNDYILVIVSAIAFGAVHSLGIPIILYGMMGAVWTIVYIKSDRNLTAAVIAHMINNVLGVVILFMS